MPLFKLAAVAFLFASTATAQDLTEDRVRELVLETILANPEVVLEAVDIMRQQRVDGEAVAAEKLAFNRILERIKRDPNAPALGNLNGDVTIIEFNDYNCPNCRRIHPDMEVLLGEDSGLRVVVREWPIFGEGSIFAARAVLAAREQGQYEALHDALMELDSPAVETTVIATAGRLGLDVERLRRDMNSEEVEEHIRSSSSLAQLIGFSGTPSFVIGQTPHAGAPDLSTLRDLVDEARSR